MMLDEIYGEVLQPNQRHLPFMKANGLRGRCSGMKIGPQLPSLAAAFIVDGADLLTNLRTSSLAQ